jgi:hypothetical protein
MRSTKLLLGSLSLGMLTSLAACAGDNGGDGGGGSSSSSTTTSTTSSTTSTTTTSSTSGTGGEGGGTGGSGTGGSGGGGTGGGGTGGGAAAPDHLLISEVSVQPATGEFVEIYNPTNAAVDLSNVYLSDNSTYHTVTAGTWNPITNNAGTDFLARFPNGTSIAAGGVIVLGFDPGYEQFYTDCPDFVVGTAALTCNMANVPAMLAPVTNSITDSANLSNDDEMLVLFRWSGNANDPVEDLDYVIWGAYDATDAGARMNKTNVSGYAAETAPAQQTSAAAPALNQSAQRCDFEIGEDTSGGNGITGHDETSENLAQSFEVTDNPSPGSKNACLP